MHARIPGQAAFKRQVVFRIDAEDWPLLEAAAGEHGSIQAAVIAGIRALAPASSAAAEDEQAPPPPAGRRRQRASREPEPPPPDEEIPARVAASLLGLRTSTVKGYIRSGRLPGRYDDDPGGQGWLTSRAAVASYSPRRP